MRVISWVAVATLFLLLFGLAANNQHEGLVKGFFGAEWRAPMIVVLLLSFAAGALLTLVSMLPPMLKRAAARARPVAARKPDKASAAAALPTRVRDAAGLDTGTGPSVTAAHPPRDGL
jgi:lipopolysaccharide assembly protein A